LSGLRRCPTTTCSPSSAGAPWTRRSRRASSRARCGSRSARCTTCRPRAAERGRVRIRRVGTSNRTGVRYALSTSRVAVHRFRLLARTVGGGSYRRRQFPDTARNTARGGDPAMTAPDREKALQLALAQIEKNHGKGSVMRLGDDTRPPIGVIPTGSIALDVALGVGGLPRGRVVEVYGPESSGKTTVALHAVASAQATGGIAAFIDAEHALDPEYAKALGVDTDALLVSQPDTGEQALEIADMLIRSGALDIIVIDSVAALVPRAEIEGEMGDSHVGLQARLMSQALRK